jgi:hypothetical protein
MDAYEPEELRWLAEGTRPLTKPRRQQTSFQVAAQKPDAPLFLTIQCRMG